MQIARPQIPARRTLVDVDRRLGGDAVFCDGREEERERTPIGFLRAPNLEDVLRHAVILAVSSRTDYPELDAVLRDLVESARAILGANFCGAYLHGSFAAGDADEYSDVDFMVVTHDEVSDAQQTRLQAMHRRIFALATPWAQHLEGSYVPKHKLRRVDPTRSSFLYLDNGADQLVRDNHCNTAVVRRVLREHGLTLEGPEPRTLIDRISAGELRREALARVREYAEWAPEPTEAGPMSRWKQSYLVLTFCRLLFTIDTGRVASKREAGEWALSALDPEWKDLVERALADRADPWERVHEPATPDLIERTLRFGDYAVSCGDQGLPRSQA